MASTIIYKRQEVFEAINTLKNKGYKLSGKRELLAALNGNFTWLFPKLCQTTIKVIAPRCRKAKELTLGELIALARDASAAESKEAQPEAAK